MEHKIRILIVEDEAIIAQNLKFTLEDLGYEVAATCYTYAEALAEIHIQTADLVMLDINLGSSTPGEDGLALARHLATQQPEIPFIFLTAYSDAATIRNATRLKPSGYLIKPVNPASVFAAIQTAIERQQLGEAAAGSEPEVAPAAPDFFFVKLGQRNHKLYWRDVYCMEAGKNYIRLRLTKNAGEYPMRGTITFVMDHLVPAALQSLFIRVNRGACVNKAFITTYTSDIVVCQGEEFENTRYTAKELTALLAV